LSFDMSDEVFLKTQFPSTYRKCAEKLFVLNELIAINFPRIIDEQGFKVSYDIWALLKVGIKESWCNDPPPMTQYCPLLAPQTRLPRRSPILGLLSQKHA